MKSKILKLKNWVTVEEAADRLSIIAGETVKKSDILHFALDGHLILSVNFVNHAVGRPFRIEPLAEPIKLATEEQILAATGRCPLADILTLEMLSSLGPETNIPGTDISLNYAEELFPSGKEKIIWEGEEQQPESLQGVWDLLMLGAERLDVEHAYQQLTGGSSVNLTFLGGPLVRSPNSTKCYQLLDHFKVSNKRLDIETVSWVDSDLSDSRLEYRKPTYYPAEGLPPDSVLVVRTSELMNFEHKLMETEEKPLEPRERKSVGQIIAVLAAEAKIDISKPHKASTTLMQAAAEHGLDFPQSEDTVVRYLKIAMPMKDKGHL